MIFSEDMQDNKINEATYAWQAAGASQEEMGSRRNESEAVVTKGINSAIQKV